MGFALVTPAASTPVSLDEVKARLRVEHAEDDAMISGMIAAATDRVERMLGRALVSSVWALTLEAFPVDAITLPLPPCSAVGSLVYLDAAGAEQTLDPSDYRVFGLGDEGGAKIHPAVGASWPDTAELPGAVVVTFTAGYGAAAAVPPAIREAILTVVADLWRFPESVTAAAGLAFVPVPVNVRDIAANNKVWAF